MPAVDVGEPGRPSPALGDEPPDRQASPGRRSTPADRQATAHRAEASEPAAPRPAAKTPDVSAARPAATCRCPRGRAAEGQEARTRPLCRCSQSRPLPAATRQLAAPGIRRAPAEPRARAPREPAKPSPSQSPSRLPLSAKPRLRAVDRTLDRRTGPDRHDRAGAGSRPTSALDPHHPTPTSESAARLRRRRRARAARHRPARGRRASLALRRPPMPKPVDRAPSSAHERRCDPRRREDSGHVRHPARSTCRCPAPAPPRPAPRPALSAAVRSDETPTTETPAAADATPSGRHPDSRKCSSTQSTAHRPKADKPDRRCRSGSTSHPAFGTAGASGCRSAVHTSSRPRRQRRPHKDIPARRQVRHGGTAAAPGAGPFVPAELRTAAALPGHLAHERAGPAASRPGAGTGTGGRRGEPPGRPPRLGTSHRGGARRAARRDVERRHARKSPYATCPTPTSRSSATGSSTTFARGCAPSCSSTGSAPG